MLCLFLYLLLLYDRIEEKRSTTLNMSYSFAQYQSLPLMREVDSPQGEDGGRDNYPSGKNQRFLPAPLTRGALGAPAPVR